MNTLSLLQSRREAFDEHLFLEFIFETTGLRKHSNVYKLYRNNQTSQLSYTVLPQPYMFAPWKWGTKVQILTYCRANQEWQWRNTVFTIAQLNTCVYTSLELTPIDRTLVYLSIDSR